MKHIYLTVIAITVLGQGCATTQNSFDDRGSQLPVKTNTLSSYDQYEKKQVFRRGHYIKSKYGYYITDLSINLDNKVAMISCNKSLLVTDLSRPYVGNKKVLVKPIFMACK
ncbi:MAG: hypothetical protein QM500_10640 [Methylococcales bacterium]